MYIVALRVGVSSSIVRVPESRRLCDNGRVGPEKLDSQPKLCDWPSAMSMRSNTFVLWCLVVPLHLH